MTESLIPSNDLCIKAWWLTLLSGDMVCGYGGAHPPREPKPLRLPSPHLNLVDYREQIRFAIAKDRNRELSKFSLSDDDPSSISMRTGTLVEPVEEGSVYILLVLGYLISAFARFYKIHRRAHFRVLPENIVDIERIVKLRVILIAIGADAYIPSKIDKYIANTLVRHLPHYSTT